MNHFLIIAAGGAVGASLRHGVNLASLRLLGPAFPYATIAVNVVGCLVMGLLVAWLTGRGGSETMRLFLATGLLGGFTTFSAFSLDFANMFQRGDIQGAMVYAVLSIGLSIMALFVGLALGKVLF